MTTNSSDAHAVGVDIVDDPIVVAIADAMPAITSTCHANLNDAGSLLTITADVHAAVDMMDECSGSKAKPMKRTRSLDAINDITEAAEAEPKKLRGRGRGRPKVAVVTKSAKPKSGKTKITTIKKTINSRKNHGNNGIDEVSYQAEKIVCIDNDSSVTLCNSDDNSTSVDHTTTTNTVSTSTQTQTDGNDISPTLSTHKNLAETVADSMTTFMTTVGARVTSLQNEMNQMQDVLVQLTEQISDMSGLRHTVQLLSTQHDVMKELRDAIMSTHNTEVQQLRDVIQQQQQQLSVQQNEMKKLQEMTNQSVNQLVQQSVGKSSNVVTVSSVSSDLTTSQTAQISAVPMQLDSVDAPTLRWRMRPANSSQTAAVSDEVVQFQFPPPPQLNELEALHQSESHTVDSRKQLKEDILASMYIDMDLKQRRANNIIISGLPHKSPRDDLHAVTRLLTDEFDLRHEPAVSCRRVGRHVDGRIQPLLVTMESRQDADYVISSAKLLRRSRDPSVREHVFISADLTPAEARAAYEVRCRRRAAGNQSGAVSGRTYFRSQAVESGSSAVAATNMINHHTSATDYSRTVHSSAAAGSCRSAR